MAIIKKIRFFEKIITASERAWRLEWRHKNHLDLKSNIFVHTIQYTVLKIPNYRIAMTMIMRFLSPNETSQTYLKIFQEENDYVKENITENFPKNNALLPIGTNENRWFCKTSKNFFFFFSSFGTAKLNYREMQF